MRFHYADFAAGPSLPDYYSEIEADCYKAGKAWGQVNRKLPRIAQVGDRRVPVLQSSHPFGRAFVSGFKSVR